MISKPKESWTRESREVVAVRQLGKATSKVASGVTSAVHLVRGIFFGFFALLWGFAALAAGLGGSISTLIGAGGAALLVGWLAKRSLSKAFGTGTANDAESDLGTGAADMAWDVRDRQPAISPAPTARARAPLSNARAASASINYHHGKLIWRAIKLAAVTAVMIALIFAHTKWGAFGTLAAIGWSGYAGWRLFTTLAKLTHKDMRALSWNDRQVTIGGLLSSSQVPWGAIEDIDIKRRVWRIYGFIPIWRSHYLIVRVYEDGGSRTFKLPIGVLDIRPEAMANFLTRFEDNQARRGRPLVDDDEQHDVGFGSIPGQTTYRHEPEAMSRPVPQARTFGRKVA